MGSMFSEAPKPDSSEKAVWMQWRDSRYVRSYRNNNDYNVHLSHDVTVHNQCLLSVTLANSWMKWKSKQITIFFNFEKLTSIKECKKMMWKDYVGSITSEATFIYLTCKVQTVHSVQLHTKTHNEWVEIFTSQLTINWLWLSIYIKGKLLHSVDTTWRASVLYCVGQSRFSVEKWQSFNCFRANCTKFSYLWPSDI